MLIWLPLRVYFGQFTLIRTELEILHQVNSRLVLGDSVLQEIHHAIAVRSYDRAKLITLTLTIYLGMYY